MTRWMTTRQVAEMLGVRPKTLEQWRWLGNGPRFCKLGDGWQASVRYSRDDVEAWLVSRTRPDTSGHVTDTSAGPTRDDDDIQAGGR